MSQSRHTFSNGMNQIITTSRKLQKPCQPTLDRHWQGLRFISPTLCHCHTAQHSLKNQKRLPADFLRMSGWHSPCHFLWISTKICNEIQFSMVLLNLYATVEVSTRIHIHAGFYPCNSKQHLHCFAEKLWILKGYKRTYS